MKTAYLDIETNYVGTFQPPDDRFFRDYRHHQITVLGVRVVEEESDVLVQLIEQDISKNGLLGVLEGVQKLVTYNGRSIPDRIRGSVGFDFPVIAAQLGIVLDKQFNHTDLVPECWERGLYGGQKRVEADLGLHRKLPGRDGGWAMETWRRFVKTGDRKYLEELLLYNKEDVLMLREIERRLGKR
jgi:uncharacterized protein